MAQKSTQQEEHQDSDDSGDYFWSQCRLNFVVFEKKSQKFSLFVERIKSRLISPRLQWEEYICPECDDLMNDPVQTFCGHRMCYRCFNMKKQLYYSWCPVGDDDDQRHMISMDNWHRDEIVEQKINKLLVRCNKCKVECTVKEYRKFDCSSAHQGPINSKLISPRSQWEEYICLECNDLMNDPVQTSCGHRMCYECFNKKKQLYDSWCPVRDDDGQRHKMSKDDWFKDRAAKRQIDKLLIICEKCQVKCTMKEYRESHSSSNRLTQEEFVQLCCFLVKDCIKDLPHWKELLLQNGIITPSELHGVTNNELFTKVLPATGCKGVNGFLQCLKCNCPDCECLLADILNLYKLPINDMRSLLSVDTYTKLASLKTFRELKKLSPDQQQELITQVLKETLPEAKDDLSIDDILPLLCQNQVITNEEATELLGVFTGEEKITRLYTKMLPKKGLEGLKEFMRTLFDTGWDTPSHIRHLGVLSKTLADKLEQIKSAGSILSQHNNEEAAKEAIVPMVYSESLPDAVINLSTSIDKLLLPLLKKHLVFTHEYYWLRGVYCRWEKLEYLYTTILPQKGVEGLKVFMEVLQDVGRKTPKYQKHLDLLKSNLRTLL